MYKKSNFVLTAILFSLLFGVHLCYGSDSLHTVHFSHPNIIRYNKHGFIINGKRTYIFSAGFHYYRLTPKLWNDRLQKIKAAGFNTVETYVPWNFQEQEPGKAHFANLNKFINDCAKHNLWVIIRPGPFINAEWDEGGWPHWLAYKEIGFRTDTPLDTKWSKYWYNKVMPVIKKHQITNGGNIILMQLENEYDFSGLPDSVRTNYLKSLYHAAKKNGINIPMITNWTSIARDNTDSTMAQILDTDDFYPKWNFSEVGHGAQTIRRTEPNAPAMVAELQGGWFSSVNTKTVRHPNLYGPAQINALTKYVISHGFDAFNYYMGYGGTNYGYHGSWGRTTSYDYTAPISEAGGLWKKYRAVKLLGDFVNITGSEYTQLPVIPDDVSTRATGVNTILRGNQKEKVLYVYNTTKQKKRTQIQINNGSDKTTLNVRLAPQASKFYFIKDSKEGATVENANVQLSQFTRINNTPFILAYGHKGNPVSMTVNGQHIGDRVIGDDQWLKTGNAVVGLTSWGRAARSRVFESNGHKVSIISDSYDMSKEKSGPGQLNLNVKTRPGSDNMSVVSGQPLKNVQVNGHSASVRSQKKGNLYINKFRVQTPPSPFKAINFSNARVARAPEHSGKKGQSLKKLDDGSY
ncbi:MAG TPA: beta-galactosidase, partial [Balneolaceae bacterium]|nr:beta-galactosidase [Balneolaceae bacterium]